MKPYIVCHMMSSVDGRSLTDGWRLPFVFDAYEETAATFGAQAWICGRVTMQEVAHHQTPPAGLAKGPIPRENRIVERGAAQYAIWIDPQGRVGWQRNTALDSHVVEVLTEQVSDDYLAFLQSLGISYVFAGREQIDLHALVDTLGRELGLHRLIVEGGSHVSGAFVNAGLVDEVSVLIVPLVDGRDAHPSSFEVSMQAWQQPAYLSLDNVARRDNDVLWLRYRRKAPPAA